LVANLVKLTRIWNFDQDHVNSAVRFIPPVGCHVIGRDWARVEFGRIRSLDPGNAISSATTLGE
jgi:hypothetical protein